MYFLSRKSISFSNINQVHELATALSGQSRNIRSNLHLYCVKLTTKLTFDIMYKRIIFLILQDICMKFCKSRIWITELVK